MFFRLFGGGVHDLKQHYGSGSKDDHDCQMQVRGAEYNRTDTKFLVTHKADASCEVCGAMLESWDSTHVPSFELIKRPDGKSDRPLDCRT